MWEANGRYAQHHRITCYFPVSSGTPSSQPILSDCIFREGNSSEYQYFATSTTSFRMIFGPASGCAISPREISKRDWRAPPFSVPRPLSYNLCDLHTTNAMIDFLNKYDLAIPFHCEITLCTTRFTCVNIRLFGSVEFT